MEFLKSIISFFESYRAVNNIVKDSEKRKTATDNPNVSVRFNAATRASRLSQCLKDNPCGPFTVIDDPQVDLSDDLIDMTNCETRVDHRSHDDCQATGMTDLEYQNKIKQLDRSLHAMMKISGDQTEEIKRHKFILSRQTEIINRQLKDILTIKGKYTALVTTMDDNFSEFLEEAYGDECDWQKMYGDAQDKIKKMEEERTHKNKMIESLMAGRKKDREELKDIYGRMEADLDHG